MKLNSFPHYLQLDAMDCGPSCLRMIAKYYGKSYSLQTLRARSFITREGVSMLGISDAAESIGFRTSGVRISLEQLKKDVPLPCILHWNQNHFVVCYDIKKKRSGYRFYIADPARQLISYSEEEFKKCWLSTKVNGEEKGAALALEPGPEFQGQGDEEESGSRSLRFFLKYLSPYRKQLIQLILGMLTASLLQLIFPFLTQSLVDVGIRDGNLNFITLILISQLVISVSQLSVEFIRSWIMLHMNTRIKKTPKLQPCTRDAVAIYIRQTFQEFHTFHLVFSFFNAKMSESSIFKFQSAVVTSTVVEAEHDITFVGHVDIPATCTVLPTAGDHLGVRSTVYIDNGGVFLVRIKVRRFYETIIKISHTVGSFDGAYFDARHGEVLEWIFCCQQIDAFPVLCGDKVDAAWHFRAGIGIYEVTAVCTQCAVVYTFRCA